MKNKAVAITGIGLISPWGEHIEDIMMALDKPQQEARETPFAVQTVDQFDAIQKLGKKGLRQMNRSAIFSTYAALECLEDAGLKDSGAPHASGVSDDLGIVLGTQFGHLDRLEHMMKIIRDEGACNLNPTDAGYGGLNVLASMIGVRTKAKSVNATINNGCTSGLDAVQYACRMINCDHAKYILAGGVETTSQYYLEWLQQNGYSSAYEGAGFISLEKPETAAQRGAKIYGVIRGFSAFSYGDGNSGGASFNMTKSIHHTLRQAGISVDEVDLFIGSDKGLYINNETAIFHPKRTLFIKDIWGEGMAVSGIYQILIALQLLHGDYTTAFIHLCGREDNSSSILLTNRAEN